MSGAKSIQLILARQLASCVAMPILLVDATGTLVYFNEPAEAMMNRRFEETGEVAADEWNALVTIADEHRNPIPLEERPLRVALHDRRPVSRAFWTRGVDSEWQHLQITAFPLVGERDQLLGAMILFWET